MGINAWSTYDIELAFGRAPDFTMDPTPFDPDSEEDQYRIGIFDDVIRVYGARWFAGALTNYLDDKAANCSCSSDDPCCRCLLREHLGLPEDRYTRAELEADLAAMRSAR